MNAPSPGTVRLAVGISSCLLGREVRYDGGHKRTPQLEALLGPHVAWIPVCPEVEIGLGVPREPIRLEGRADALRLVEIASGRDLTGLMAAFAEGRIRELVAAGLCGYVFKKNSPSCGVAGVPVHDGEEISGRAAGLFAGLLAARCPGLPVVEEDDLETEEACLDFLGRARAYRAR